MLPGIIFLIALIAAIIHIGCRKKARTNARVIEIFLAYMIPLSIGVMGIVAWIAYAFYADQVAAMMSWQSSPFQFELAVANLGIGVIGLLSLWQRKGFWLSTVISFCVFHIGAGIGYFMMMVDNKSSCCKLMIFINCIIIPLVLFILTWIYSKQNKYFKA